MEDYLLVIYPYGDLRDRLLEEQQQFSTEYYAAGHVSPAGKASDGRAQHTLQGQQRLAGNKPHITLAAFQAGEETEDTVIRWIQRICHQLSSFDIALNNYSGIPPHTPKPPEAGASLRTSFCQWQERSSRPSGQSLADCREYANFSWQHIPGTIYLRVQDPQPLRDLMQQLKAIDEFIRSSGWPPVNLTGRPYLSIAGGLTEKVYNRAMPDYSRKTFHGIFRVDELVLLKRRHSFDPCKTVNVFRLLPE